MTGIGQDPFLCICAEGFTGDACNATESGQENMFTVYFRSYLQISNVLNLLAVRFTSHLINLFFATGPCNPNPCKNDGICEVITNSKRGDVFNNEYECKCQLGFKGAHCQISKFLEKA